jgi:nitroreductase
MTEHPKFAAAEHDVHELIRRRWSPRAFDAARPVPRAELLRLFEAARWAPSSFNEQPWRFLVLERNESPGSSWRALMSTLTVRNQSWAAAAPVLVLVAVKPTFDQNGAVNQVAWYDAGQAVAFLSLQATAQGISLRQMEGFDRDAARTALQVPSGFEPAVVMAVGYAGEPESLEFEKHREAERKPRQRRAVGEIVTFLGDHEG